HLHIFSLLLPPPPRSTLFPYTTLFRSTDQRRPAWHRHRRRRHLGGARAQRRRDPAARRSRHPHLAGRRQAGRVCKKNSGQQGQGDRKSTRLNSSHVSISYAVFCLKKKK